MSFGGTARNQDNHICKGYSEWLGYIADYPGDTETNASFF